MESEQRVPLDEAGKHMLASVNKMLITEAVEKLDTAANNEMELHGVSVLWSKITRAKGILHEALALEGHGNG